MSESVIKSANLPDMGFFIDCAKQEGWNPGLGDVVPFFLTDTHGFFIEYIDHQPIGCISSVAYSNSYGFMGFYYIKPEFRHQGYGIKLWNHAIHYLGNRAIGLDGVVEQQDNYRKSGFQFYYNNIRYKSSPRGKSSAGLQSLGAISSEVIKAYDASVCGYNRDGFLRLWTAMPHSYGLAKINNKRLCGYGVIRQCQTGCKIGPLFADNFDIADEIFQGLVDRYRDMEIFLDIPQTNESAIPFIEKYKMEKVFETARMYKGTPPKQLLSHVYGVTTFELG